MIYFYIMLRISINSSPIRFLTSKCQNMCVCVCHVNCEMQSMPPNGSCHIMKLCYRIFFAVLRFFIAIDFPIKTSHRISLKISHRNHRFSKAPCPVSLHVSASLGREARDDLQREVQFGAAGWTWWYTYDNILYVCIHIYIMIYYIYMYMNIWLYDYMIIWLHDYMIIYVWLYMCIPKSAGYEYGYHGIKPDFFSNLLVGGSKYPTKMK